MDSFSVKSQATTQQRKDFIGRDDNNGIMQYTTDLRNVYFHLS